MELFLYAKIIRWLHPYRRGRPLTMSVMIMKLNCFWWRNSKPETLEDLKYPFIDSNPTLIQNGSSFRVPSMDRIGLSKKRNHHHHHHVVSLARISLTLSRHFSLSFIASGRSSGLHPVSSHSCWMYVRAGRPAFARPYVGVHSSTSLMSSSLLLQ